MSDPVRSTQACDGVIKRTPKRERPVCAECDGTFRITATDGSVYYCYKCLSADQQRLEASHRVFVRSEQRPSTA